MAITWDEVWRILRRDWSLFVGRTIGAGGGGEWEGEWESVWEWEWEWWRWLRRKLL